MLLSVGEKIGQPYYMPLLLELLSPNFLVEPQYKSRYLLRNSFTYWLERMRS